jgi:hypothetical protein
LLEEGNTYIDEVNTQVVVSFCDLLFKKRDYFLDSGLEKSPHIFPMAISA